MRYRLVQLNGAQAGRVRSADDDERELVLGRDPTAQLVFPAEERLVSRRHAALVQDGATLLLRDLGSTSGTFLDGQDIEEAELDDGDEFELGPGGPRLRVDFVADGTVVVSEGPLIGQPSAPPGRAPRVTIGPGARLKVAFLSGPRTGTTLVVAGSVVRIGRAGGNTISLPEDPSVSAQHAKIVRFSGAFMLLDLESTNGTFLNRERIERARLQDGDVVQLGPGGPALRIEIVPPDPADQDAQATVVIPDFAELAGRRISGSIVRELELDRPVLSIGRGADCDVQLDSPIVSKQHARVVDRAGVRWIEDLGSANGTYLGGRRIEQAPLGLGDRVVVGPYQLEVLLGRLRLLDTRHRARLDACDLTVRFGEQTILSDVSLALAAGSFTAIIGPSGSGKSTLLGALSGARPATQGRVLVNGLDLYTGFAALKSTIGLVPQDDIVHRDLTVAESLDFAARLRLPPDTDAVDRQRRCEAVLATLELSERAKVPIHRLSGGQRKRVSIATELLTEPSLLFLDEPAAGLDPGLEEALMLLLRELSYKGKTVVLVTHSLDHVHLCDSVVLLAGGRLAYVGSCDDLARHFLIQRLPDLYLRLKEHPADEWARTFKAGAAYHRQVIEPLARAGAPPLSLPQRPAPPSTPKPLRQLVVLTRRYATTLVRDSRNAAMLLAQAPIIAALIGLSLLYGTSDVAFTKPRNTILFLLALTAIWFGCSNAAREIVKERAIYLRERMVNLSILGYLGSKVLVLGTIAGAQCVLFLLILDLWFGIPGHPVLLLAGMLLSALVGIALGLALSALASSPDRAMTLLPLLLIPQVLFTIPAVHMDMRGPAGLVAKAMPTWWSFDLLRRLALAPDTAMPHDVIEKRLEAGETVLMTKQRFEEMFREGYPVLQHRSRIEVTWTASAPERLAERLPAALGRWRPVLLDTGLLCGLGLGLLALSGACLRRLDRRP
jgi:ABC-type multidrug transport system ATPase subunit/pSer/pThr/pTyr-binding forkhead associated (FHA) protein